MDKICDNNDKVIKHCLATPKEKEYLPPLQPAPLEPYPSSGGSFSVRFPPVLEKHN